MIPFEIKPVDCKKCSFNYCPCCETRCPKCGEVDIPDNPETVLFLQQIREVMNIEDS